MFDIGFSEMLVCAIVALVVIGPERLPRVARTMGHLFGRLQRYVAQVKTDINREMELAELGKVKSEFENAARSFQSEVQSKAAEAEREIRDVQAAIDQLDGASQPRDQSVEAAAVPPAAAETPATLPRSPQLELGIDETGSPGRPRKEASG
jgi:sec-independent protein translocase protein TatB